MDGSQALSSEGRISGRPSMAIVTSGSLAKMPATRVTESRGGRIVVQHEDGYVFVFQVHDVEDLVMNLEDVVWSPIGAPPDAEELEQQARDVAELEARHRGWMV